MNHTLTWLMLLAAAPLAVAEEAAKPAMTNALMKDVKRLVFVGDSLTDGSAWCDWVWEVAPSANGSLVKHSWIDRRGKFANWLGGKVSGVTDRASHNRANMERTIEALAGAVRGS